MSKAEEQTVKEIRKRLQARYGNFKIAAKELNVAYSTLMAKLGGRYKVTTKEATEWLKIANGQDNKKGRF